MFVYSLRAKTIKLIGAAAVCVAAVAFVIAVLPTGKNVTFSASATEKTVYSGVECAEDAKSFLASFGIETGDLLDTSEVVIPKKFDSAYDEYNSIQRSEGFDLSKYRGKSVIRYTFPVTNCPKNGNGEPAGDVFANVITFRSNVIGGDICTFDMGGKTAGFSAFAKFAEL